MPRKSIDYWLALKLVPRLAIDKKLALVNALGISALFESRVALPVSGLSTAQSAAFAHPNWQKIEQIITASAQANSTIIAFDDKHYPDLLREIFDPPLVLYVQGNADLLKQPQLAIVGSRNASISGREIAFDLARQLSQAGLVITSGLALGIDGYAHRGALQNTCSTIAVVATGLDKVYPSRNQVLARDILAKQGCIVSEFIPGTPPKAGHFPRRNRLISGLSLGVVVVEAAIKSGSLITARCAIEQNRDVFAVPGSINSPYCKGCHRLIKQGAKLIEGAADIIDELDLSLFAGLSNYKAEKLGKSTQKDLFMDPLLASVGYEITTVDTVASRSELPIDVVLTRLTMLELSGLVCAVPGGYLRLNRG